MHVGSCGCVTCLVFRGWAYMCALDCPERTVTVSSGPGLPSKKNFSKIFFGVNGSRSTVFPAPSARQSISWVSSMRYVKPLCAPPSVSQLVIFSRVLVFVDSKDCHGERRCGAQHSTKIAEVRTKTHVIYLRHSGRPFVCFLTAALPSCGTKMGMLLTRSTCVH